MVWMGFVNRSSPVACDTGDVGKVAGMMESAGLGGFLSRISNKNETPKTVETSPTIATPAPVPAVEPVAAEAHPVDLFVAESNDPLSPVQYEQFSREFSQMSGQDNFDGFRLEAQKTVTKQLQANHSLFLGTSMREAGYMYQFGPTFALDNGRMFLMGRYGNDGCMNARALKKIGSGSEARISASSSLDTEQKNMLEVAVDHSGSDWSTSLKTAWQGTWILNSAFSQVITPKLQMGGDLSWISANGATIASAGLRYRLSDATVSASFVRQPNFKSPTGLTQNCHSCKLQYHRKVSDRLSLGVELELGEEKPGYESALRFGYEYLFRQARVQGLIDTGGRVSLCAQEASGFGVSGMIDYWKNDYRFGFMMQIIPPPEGAQPM